MKDIGNEIDYKKSMKKIQTLEMLMTDFRHPPRRKGNDYFPDL
jgi:hypothetical protein